MQVQRRFHQHGGEGGAAAFAAPNFLPQDSMKLTNVLSPAKQADGKVLVYGASQDVATIDPSDRVDYSINAVMRQMYDRLFRFEGGWPQPVEPGLCQKWSASDDAKEWTFEITDQAKFHDGSALTADDVVYSYQRTLRAQK